MIHKVCFYGQYRKGDYGHQRIKTRHGEDAIKYKKTITIPGFVLYLSRKGHAAACCRGNMTDRIVVDLCELSGDEVYDSILRDTSMAIIQEELVAIDNSFYTILIYTFRPMDAMLIDSGDWFKLPKIIENVENY